MTDRSKTAWILGTATLIMFSPLAIVLAGYPIPMFQNLGFEGETIAPPLAWILATIVGIVYVFYTMKAIPLVAEKQSEISLYQSYRSNLTGEMAFDLPERQYALILWGNGQSG